MEATEGYLMKRYKVYQESCTLLVETDDKDLAIDVMRTAHKDKPFMYHELYEYIDGKYIGIRQYEPGDKIYDNT